MFSAKYQDLRSFIQQLYTLGELKQITLPVSPILEVTAICDAVLRAAGPALLFQNLQNYSFPLLANLFGTTRRVALGMGLDQAQDPSIALRQIGHLLAQLKEPELPLKINDLNKLSSMAKAVWHMSPKWSKQPCCQEISWEGNQVDLSHFPIQKCWQGDIAPLITWGLTITQGPHKKRQNLGIYRQQVIAANKIIMRWLPHRGGALDFCDFIQAFPGKPFPVAVALGADPATLLAAVTPIPDSLSEYQFAGLLRGARTELAHCLTPGLMHLSVPARAEIILEGFIYPGKNFKADTSHPTRYEYALEGPFGDHTGYYNEQEWFPVLTIKRITLRDQAIYHSTYTGKPPDEPAILGAALNEVFIPLLQKQFPEITDFYLPPEACSYRIALVQIKKSYPGHAKRVMFGVWGFLRQFMYTKFIIVLDEDILIRNWKEVIWAISTRVDPQRDTLIIDNTPIDYLDFASPVSGLGAKMGLDATNKWPGETQRKWGKSILLDQKIQEKVEIVLQEISKK